MHIAHLVGWMGIGAGVLLAFMVARKSSGSFGIAMALLLFADVFLGLLLMGGVFALSSGCTWIGLCPRSHEHSAWFAVYLPLAAIPAYWLSTLIGMLTRPDPTADGPREGDSSRATHYVRRNETRSVGTTTRLGGVAIGLATTAPLFFVDCLTGLGDGSIVLVGVLLVISLPWNIGALMLIGAIHHGWPEGFERFYQFVWQITACHQGRAPSLEWSVIWYSFIVGTFVNTQVVYWLFARRKRSRLPAANGAVSDVT